MMQKLNLEYLVLLILMIGFSQADIILNTRKQYINKIGKLKPIMGISPLVIEYKHPKCEDDETCLLKAFYTICTITEVKDRFRKYGNSFQYVLLQPSFVITMTAEEEINRDVLNCQPISNISIRKRSSEEVEESYPTHTFNDLPYSDKLHVTVRIYIVYYSNNKVSRIEPYTKYVNTINTGKSKGSGVLPIKKVGSLTLFFKNECAEGYYRSKCWYKCKTDEKQVCTCTKHKYKKTIKCQVNCKEGYLKRKVYYKVDPNKYENAETCDVRNICETKPCSDKLCLAINSKTRICEKHFDFKILNNKRQNLTTDFLFIDDVFTLELVKPSKNLYRYSNKLFIFLCPKSKVVTEKILKPLTRTKFIVTDKGKLDFAYKMRIGIYLEDWDMQIYHEIKFRKFRKIQIVLIFINDGKLLKTSLLSFLTPLKCTSKAEPEYRELQFWSSNEKDALTNYVGSNTKIQQSDKSDLFTIQVKCVVYLIPDSKIVHHRTGKITLKVKPNSKIKWDQIENIHRKDSCDENGFLINCGTNVSFVTQNSIFKLQGKTDLNITVNGLNVCLLAADFYGFICYTKLGETFTSKIIRFQNIENPTKACFQLIRRVRGAIIQCNHNGYFQESHRTEIEVFGENNVKLTKGYNYVRIPYTVEASKLKVVCQVVNDERIPTNTKILRNYTIESLPYASYTLDDSTKNCLNDHKPIDIFLDGFTYEDNLVKIDQMVYYGTIEKSSTMHLIAVIVLAIFYNVFPMVVFTAAILFDYKTKRSMTRIAQDYRLKLTRSNINRRIHEEFNKCMEMQMTDPTLKQSFVFKFFHS